MSWRMKLGVTLVVMTMALPALAADEGVSIDRQIDSGESRVLLRQQREQTVQGKRIVAQPLVYRSTDPGFARRVEVASNLAATSRQDEAIPAKPAVYRTETTVSSAVLSDRPVAVTDRRVAVADRTPKATLASHTRVSVGVGIGTGYSYYEPAPVYPAYPVYTEVYSCPPPPPPVVYYYPQPVYYCPPPRVYYCRPPVVYYPGYCGPRFGISFSFRGRF